MTAVSAMMMATALPSPQASSEAVLLDQALSLYRNIPNSHQWERRVSLSKAAILSDWYKDRERSAAWYEQLAEQESSSVVLSAMLSEAAALSHLNNTSRLSNSPNAMLRKFAFNFVLAAQKYGRVNLLDHSLRYQSSPLKLFPPLSSIFDISFNLVISWSYFFTL